MKKLVLALLFIGINSGSMAHAGKYPWVELKDAFDAADPFDLSLLQGDEIWSGTIVFPNDYELTLSNYWLAIVADRQGLKRPLKAMFGLFELRRIAHPAPQDRSPAAVRRFIETDFGFNGAKPVGAKADKSVVMAIPGYGEEYELRMATDKQGQRSLLFRAVHGVNVSTYGQFDRLIYSEVSKP